MRTLEELETEDLANTQRLALYFSPEEIKAYARRVAVDAAPSVADSDNCLGQKRHALTICLQDSIFHDFSMLGRLDQLVVLNELTRALKARP